MKEFLCPLKDLTVAASSSLISASLSAQSSNLLKQRNKTKRAEELFAFICCLQGSGEQQTGMVSQVAEQSGSGFSVRNNA